MDIQDNILQSDKSDRFRDLIERLNVITYEFSVVAGKFTYVSRMAEAITGFTKEQWLKPGFWAKHVHPEDVEWACTYSKEQTFLLRDHEYELRFICVDGSTKWFKDMSTVTTVNGIPHKQVGVLIDVSERKQYEAELTKSKERYQALIEQQTEMITRWKPDGSFTYVNDVFCNFFEKTRDQLIGKTYIPPMPVEDLERFSRFFLQLDKDNPVGMFTHRVIMPDGDIRWLRWTDTAIFDDRGNIVEYQTVGRDITARKKAEDALKQSEEKYRRLIENTNVIAWEFDAENKKYLYVSQQAERILGYPLSDWYKQYFWYGILHDEDKLWAKKFSNEKILSGESHDFEYRVIARDGSIKWFRDITTVDKFHDTITLHGILIDITDRKTIEEKSKQNELQLSYLFENAPIGMSLNSMDGKFLNVNSSFCRTVGYSKEELLEIEFQKITHPEDLEADLNQLKKAISNGTTTYDLTKRYINKEGGTVYTSVHISIIRDDSGNPHQLIAQVIDITEKKLAEEKLKQTQARLTAVLNNLSNVAIYEYGDDVNFISENINDILGYPSSYFMKDKDFFGSLIIPEEIKKYDENVRNWVKQGSKGVLSSVIRAKDSSGEIKWLEDHMYQVKPKNGKPYFSGIMIDITKQKNREEKYQETEQKLSAILTNLPKVVVYQTMNGKNFISDNIEDMIGYKPEEILKGKYFFSALMPDEDRKSVAESLEDWHKNNDNGILVMEFRLRKKSGDCIWVEDHMFKAFSSTGEAYLSGILIDVTERKNAEQKANQSLNEKELLLKEIHHRVKNNLQVVSSLLKLQTSYVTDKNTHDILLDSQNRVRSMALVHQKLYQSKDFSQIDFKEYIKQLSEQLFNVFGEKSKAIKLNVDSADSYLSIDLAIPCGLIINELVSNSLKYAFPNKHKGEINIEINSRGNCYELAVIDNGVGFPEWLDFKNTNTLGLQLVNTLVGQIDGTIEMESNEGTAFRIKFKRPKVELKLN